MSLTRRTKLTKDFIPHPIIHSDSKKTFVPDTLTNSKLEFKPDEYSLLGKEVYIKKETGLDAMAGDGGYQEAYLGDAIRFKMKREGRR